MIGTAIENPAAFVHEHGDLHDVRILRVTYDVEQNTLDVEVWDLNWDAERQPGYVARPANLIFAGVAAFAIVAGQDKFHTTLVNEGASIAHAYAITKAGRSRMDIVMSTSEQWHIEFETLTVRDRDVTS